MLYPFSRISRIARDIGASRLQYAVEREEYPCSTGKEEHYPAAGLYSPFDKGICHTVRVFVKLPVAKFPVAGYDRGLIGMELCHPLDPGMEKHVFGDIRPVRPLPE